ncbi:nucleotidyl transferase AbiEii/AbiGii toxin family protein [Kitasatospora sp. MBT63]|uniref:nucleotidyl transferase AbiEii/AbiGii toxin family protein n=1 Tax=Kitasatospora sp. MBT63 TaxID=1444768 RepID=UPI0007C82FA3|nr:nucleotidyl transferase AbiEii/AbiGii toxin family protein [Kitasatospora sp. MBT63]
MNDIRAGLQRGTVPRSVPAAHLPGLGLPLTLRPVDDARATQAAVFDPALTQHPNAFRAADPSFTDPALSTGWYAARRRAMDLLLAAVADSPWAGHLVVRGSVVLRAWYGDAAREPGDLDFVVVPQDWRIEEDRTTDLLQGIACAAEAASTATVRFRAAEAVSEEIWTYDRVPGRRLVLPWHADGLPGGAVQLDFVFNEPLPMAPETVLLPALDAPGARLAAATRELSLAWKLMWLVTDIHPQGKDLYDALLLAESTPLPYRVLRDVFATGEAHYAEHPVDADTITALADRLEPARQHFEREYPHLAGTTADALPRLATALTPTFARTDPTPLGPWWAQGWIERLCPAHAEGGLGAVQALLLHSGASFRLAHRLTRTLLHATAWAAPADVSGAAPDGTALAEAMLRCPAWQYWAEQVRDGRTTIDRLLQRLG